MRPMDPTARPQPPDWMAEAVLLRSKINGVFGFEKAGKSRFLASILAHGYSGIPLAGIPVSSPGRLLYLLGEETEEDVAGRLTHAAALSGLDPDAIPWSDLVVFCPATGMRLEDANQRLWLQAQLVEQKIDTLLIDPIRRVHGGKESSNDEMAVILNDIRDWSNRLGLTIILVHHTGKISPEDDETRIATWSRGATDLPAILDWAVYVKRFRSGPSQPDQVVVYNSGRGAKHAPLRLLDHGEEHPGWSPGGKRSDP